MKSKYKNNKEKQKQIQLKIKKKSHENYYCRSYEIETNNGLDKNKENKI